MLYDFFDIRLFSYISVRALLAFFLAFMSTLYFTKKYIIAMREKAYQPIYELAPDSHKQKAKTPTMGGLIFVLCTMFVSFLLADMKNMFSICAMLCLGLFCFTGFVDDFAKIRYKDNHKGLSPKAKMLFLIISSFACILPLYIGGYISSELFVPFYKYPILDMKYFCVGFYLLVLLSSTNAVNLTDGLDGLACVPSIFSLFTLGVFVYLSSNALYANYLFLPKVAGSEELVIFIMALIGALIGFLWFNSHPASIFMGDSGSLALGGFIGYLAIVSKNEILLVLIGAVFVAETLSVILQVGSFKLRKKRIFKMAPLHHHFEQNGLSESKIIIRFWIVALLANVLALITIKLR